MINMMRNNTPAYTCHPDHRSNEKVVMFLCINMIVHMHVCLFLTLMICFSVN